MAASKVDNSAVLQEVLLSYLSSTFQPVSWIPIKYAEIKDYLKCPKKLAPIYEFPVSSGLNQTLWVSS